MHTKELKLHCNPVMSHVLEISFCKDILSGRRGFLFYKRILEMQRENIVNVKTWM